MSVRARLVAALLLVAYAVLMVAVLAEYTAGVATDVVTLVEDWLERGGAPAALTAPGRVEFVLNVALFVPASFLASLIFPRHPWANWVVYGFVLSGFVELFQGLYLPPRSAEYVDVVANTLGALVGAVLARLIVELSTPSGGPRESESTPSSSGPGQPPEP